MNKGHRLYVEGRVEYSQTEHEGTTRYWTEVVVNELVMLGNGDRPAPVSASTGDRQDPVFEEIPY